ncbi:c-type cytochrome [Haliea sp. E17]|uniref:c-type cytochrome n=1 Tax=Haliea sp. E17 TaxID=3401576 RepID=UPI003AAF383A
MRGLPGAFALALLALSLRAPAGELEDRMQLADIDRGRVLFGSCRLCHRIEAEEGHRVGPNLKGVFGRVVGTVPDYPGYSQRFRQAGFVWTPKLMYAWLEAPMAQYPDSTMLVPGISDPQDRADVIAYLMRVSAVDPD